MATIDMEKENQKIYELAYFIAPLEKEEAVFVAAEKVKNLITGRNGEIQKEEQAKRRQLAYPIKHQKHGYFGVFQFSAEPKSIQEINKVMSLDNSVLRHLITEVDKKQIIQMQKTPLGVSAQEKVKKIMEQSKMEESVFKTEEAATHKEEHKIGLEDLDQKLDELLK